MDRAGGAGARRRPSPGCPRPRAGSRRRRRGSPSRWGRPAVRVVSSCRPSSRSAAPERQGYRPANGGRPEMARAPESSPAATPTPRLQGSVRAAHPRGRPGSSMAMAGACHVAPRCRGTNLPLWPESRPCPSWSALGLSREAERLYFRVAPASGHTIQGVARLMQHRVEDLVRAVAPLVELGLVELSDDRMVVPPVASVVGGLVRRESSGGDVGAPARGAGRRGAPHGRGRRAAPRPRPGRGATTRRRAEHRRQRAGAAGPDDAHQPRRHVVAAPGRVGDAA